MLFMTFSTLCHGGFSRSWRRFPASVYAIMICQPQLIVNNIGDKYELMAIEPHTDDLLSTTEVMTSADRAFRVLEEEIVSGRIPMGTKLGEESLASRFGISRGPLREALRRLEGRSLVVSAAHAGVRVVQLKTEDLIELYEVRESLEGLAVRLAAERGSDEEIRSLRAFVDSQAARRAPDDRDYSQGIGDEDFHYRIATVSGSKRLQNLLCGDLYSLIRLCRFRTWTIPGQKRSQEDHERIMQAIEERDGELADLLMRRHVAAARARFMTAEAASTKL
jgi:DNA-binding GntR family transcriptional regulator